MKLNKNECQILHLGWSYAGHKYKLREEWLESSPAERELGVPACSRPGSQEGNGVLGCIQHITTSWAKEGMIDVGPSS